mgnify:CR=1 FL=1
MLEERDWVVDIIHLRRGKVEYVQRDDGKGKILKETGKTGRRRKVVNYAE